MSSSFEIIPMKTMPLLHSEIVELWHELASAKDIKLVGEEIKLVHIDGEPITLNSDDKLTIDTTYLFATRKRNTVSLRLDTKTDEFSHIQSDSGYLKSYCKDCSKEQIAQIVSAWNEVGYSIVLTSSSRRPYYETQFLFRLADIFSKLTDGYIFLEDSQLLVSRLGLFGNDELNRIFPR